MTQSTPIPSRPRPRRGISRYFGVGRQWLDLAELDALDDRTRCDIGLPPRGRRPAVDRRVGFPSW